MRIIDNDFFAGVSPSVAAAWQELAVDLSAVVGQLCRLTSRELEVLLLLGTGAPNPVLARWLGITDRTLKAHISHILLKLNLDSRSQAVVVAVSAILNGHPPPPSRHPFGLAPADVVASGHGRKR